MGCSEPCHIPKIPRAGQDESPPIRWIQRAGDQRNDGALSLTSRSAAAFASTWTRTRWRILCLCFATDRAGSPNFPLDSRLAPDGGMPHL